MTRRHDLSLIDDLVDNELPPERAAEVHQLIASSPEWRERYEETTRLLQALKQKKISDPGEAYRVDSANRVLSRTAAREGYTDEFVTREEYRAGLGNLTRAVLSLVASISILFGAIYLGTERSNLSQQAPNSRPILVAAPLIHSVDSEQTVFADAATHDRLARAIMLLGPPGMLGRMVGLAELQRLGE